MSLYGLQLWDIGSVYVQRFYVSWRKCIRKLFGLPYNTHCNLLHMICEDLDVKNQLYKRLVRYIRQLGTNKNMYVQTAYELASHGSNSNLCKSMNQVCAFYNLSKDDLVTDSFKPTKCMYPEVLECHASVIRELLYMRDNELYNTFSKEDVQTMIVALCTD